MSMFLKSWFSFFLTTLVSSDDVIVNILVDEEKGLTLSDHMSPGNISHNI